MILLTFVAGGLMVLTDPFELRPKLLLTGVVSLLLAVGLGFAMNHAGIELLKTTAASAQEA